VSDLGWLSSRGYAERSALALVGDRHDLVRRQREAVRRSCCSDGARAGRLARLQDLGPGPLVVDGFNVLITVEAALAGGVLLRGRDGAVRDLASVHGTWRRMEETLEAVRRVGEVLHTAGVGPVRWILDAPVSNSGRLRALLLAHGAERSLDWSVELVSDADPVVAEGPVAASSDSVVLDRAPAWVDLAGRVVRSSVPDAWLLDLGEPGDPGAGRSRTVWRLTGAESSPTFRPCRSSPSGCCWRCC